MSHLNILKLTSSGCSFAFSFMKYQNEMKSIDTLTYCVCVDFMPQIHYKTINCTIFYECMPWVCVIPTLGNDGVEQKQQDKNRILI